MSIELNKAIVRRMVEDGTNRGDLVVIDEVISSDAIDHTAPPGQPAGPAGVKQGLAKFRVAFPDAWATIESITAEGDMVAYRVTMRGTNTGPFLGRPATGRAFAAGSLTLVRVVAGQVAEHWSYMDVGSMMRQLGVAEPTGEVIGAREARR